MNMVESVDRPSAQDLGINFERITATLGAEVSGVDLTQELSDAAIAVLEDALVRHKVLFFRDQNISQEQHLAFGRRFGPLEVHPFTFAQVFSNDRTNPELIVLESTPEKAVVADSWHSDVTFRPNPSMASILIGRIIPEVGGDTLWCDMAAAFEGLDDATRSLISGLTAIHDWEVFRGAMHEMRVAEDKVAELVRQHPPSEHPVVRTHPVSGQKILYVNGNFVCGVKGMKESESRPLLERLYRQASIPDYQVRFRWRRNSIAFWDNRSTQHYATKDFFPGHRKMERVTIAGDVPF
jgi:taurine dioxygenase